MGVSASTNGVTMGKSNTSANALQQMLIPEFAITGSMSAVDELVNYKIEELIKLKDEERIVHERAKQEQLKELERNRKAEIKRIQEEANEELDYLAERIKHEMKISQEGGISNID